MVARPLPLVLGLLVAASSCGGSSSSSGASSDTSMTSLLGRLPLSVLDERADDRSRFMQISLGDYEAASTLAGLSRPSSTSLDASSEWFVDLVKPRTVDNGGTGFAIVPPDYPPLFSALPAAEQMEAEAGFSPFAVESFASVQSPPVSMAVLAGDMALAGDLTDLGDGVSTLGAGDDYEVDVGARSGWSLIGVPVRFAADEGRVAVSPSTPLIEDWLAGGETLADDPALAAAAGALDAAEVVAATLVRGDFERTGEGVIAAPFSVAAVGVAAIDGALGNVVVYVFDDAAGAARALASVEAAWSGALETSLGPISERFEPTSVEQVDRIVVVTGTITDTGTTLFPVELIWRSEPIFAHG